jgi:pilus assembly protein CpaE
VRHDSGLLVYASPGHPDRAEIVTPKHVERIVGCLRPMYDAVIIDAGSSLDGRTLSVFEQADAVAFTLYPEIAALKATLSLLEVLAETSTMGPKTIFVVNHLFAREMLKVRDIETSLAARVSMELPYDPVVYLKAVNEGIPVVRGAPRSGAAALLTRLAAILIGEAAAERSETGERHGLLGGLLHRA